MSDAIEKHNGSVNGVVGMVSWSREQTELIKTTCAPGATDAELQMFLHIAARSGLDPLRRQIHFLKVSGRVACIADINGLQARAAREPDFEGILHAVVYAKDDFAIDNVTGAVVRHTSNPLGQNGPPIGAWATVRRKGMLPFVSVVRFDEYRNQNNPLWASKPAVMIDKCAKSTALRLAYPEQLGGVFEEAEMGEEREVNAPPPAPVATQPKSAAEAKAALAAELAPKKGEVVDAKPNPLACWERIKSIAKDHGMTVDATRAEMKTQFNKTKPADLTEADVQAFARWIDDTQTVDAPAADVQVTPHAPSAQVEADVPF